MRWWQLAALMRADWRPFVGCWPRRFGEGAPRVASTRAATILGPVISSGWLFLSATIVVYGVATLLQSVAATRTSPEHSLHPVVLLRLCGQGAYVLGLICQLLGFVLAMLARRDLPLFLVQSGVMAALGVNVILGVVFFRWRLAMAELVLIVLLCLGITALILSARPAPSRAIGLATYLALGLALVIIGVVSWFAVRLRGGPGSVALGALAGLCFGAAAVASRPLISVAGGDGFFTDPLLYLLIAHSILGQLLFGLAMQRGATTAAAAAMEATGAIPAALIGLVVLGDRIWPQREWLAIVGFVVTLAAVAGLTKYARPQQYRETTIPAPAPHRSALPAAAARLTNTSLPSRQPVGTTSQSARR
jgi:hypothetical protein